MTGELMARAILSRVQQRAFGVLVRNVPEFDPEALVDGLGTFDDSAVPLRLSMPGFSPQVSKALRDRAKRAGLGAGYFATTVEAAEQWRNDRAVHETIVVVTPRELPKTHSLKRFQKLSSEQLYAQVCTEAESKLGVNEAQTQFWEALRRKEIARIVPLEGLLTYYSELASCKAAEVPTRSRDNLYLMGLLPDPDIFTDPNAPRIAKRLIENHRVVEQLEVLTRTDRQRIARSLASKSGTKASAGLQQTYQRVMAFYRDQSSERLKDLTYRDVMRLLRAREDRAAEPTDEGPGEGPAPPTTPDPPTERPETRPAVRALDLLFDGDEESLEELDKRLTAVLEAEGGADDEDEFRDPKTGVSLEVPRTHPLTNLIDLAVRADRWGGQFECAAGSLDEALAVLDKSEFRAFDPDGADWNLRAALVSVAGEVELEADLVSLYDQLRESRTRLVGSVKKLLLEPIVALAGSKGTFDEAERYLAAYRQLVEGIKRGYQEIASLAPEGIEILCSQVLALDTIVLRTSSGMKAVLSPLHPLHLWKYVELIHQLRIQVGSLTAVERDLLRNRVEALPNFVTTLYLSNYITRTGVRVLPEAGIRGGLPVFEEFAHYYAGRDGVLELRRIFEKFCTLYPHSRMGLRIALIDPPDIEFLLKELVKMRDGADGEIESVHVRVFFTGDQGRSVAALGGGADDEEGAESFRGVGANSAFTLEIHEAAMKPSDIAAALKAHPAHVAVLFDPSSAKTQRFPRSPSLSVHPLCLPMQFAFDQITKSVRVVPAADGGIFADHNDLRNRLSNQLTNFFFGVTADLKSERRELTQIAEGATWFAVLDRAQEGALDIGVSRVSLQRCGKRDLAVYTTAIEKFVSEFDRQLRRCNYTPNRQAVRRMVDDLGSLLSDGLLALVSQVAGKETLDENRTQGLVGTLVTSTWYRGRHPRSLLVSIDSSEAKRWLELVDDHSRADLFGVVDESDGSITIDIIEVKTYRDPNDAYKVKGREISGDAVSQILNTARIVEEIFELDPALQRVVSPQRREVLRQHLFRECFFEGRTDKEKQHWSKRLNELFALEPKMRLRLSLVIVGMTQARATTERCFKANGRDLHVFELTEEEIRRQLGGEPPPPSTPDGDGGHPGPGGGGAPSHGSTEVAFPRAQASAESGAIDEIGNRVDGAPRSKREDAEVASAPLEPSSHAPPRESSPSAGAGQDLEERELIARQGAELKRILRDHGIPVKELDPNLAQVGPSVVRFRVRLKTGAKVSSLRSRAEDIGRELASRTTPFIDNIGGENYVGIDLERSKRAVVPLMPQIEALAKPRGLQLPIAAGVTPSGEHVTLDLVQLPHLLVAGSTMSGKTVFLHAVLLSLIGKLPPERLELLVIDPKATDFVFYNGLPYLRGNRVITEPEDAIGELNVLTEEELRARTNTLQQARCPNLSEYNSAHPDAALKPIVVVIDEYADLVAVLSKKDRGEFERQINRLAQRARSVGIHLVLATQRPTSDIVTGLLKANMPCRVSFRLPQRVDSQTILDQAGAENLFGRGDMLLLHNDRLTRLQGYYIPAPEIAQYLGGRFPGSGSPLPAAPEPTLEVMSDTDEANRKGLVGTATGLCVGSNERDLHDGGVMLVEVEVRDGDGGCEVIGSAGGVLQDSVLAAWRHVQTHASDHGITKKALSGKSVVVHLVDIAQYREGPSAGLPFVAAMISALKNQPIRAGIALTGEVSLKGKIGPVGGIPQKLVAAFKRGRTTVIVPRENEGDLAGVPAEVRASLETVLVDTVREAMESALEAKRSRRPHKSS
jgi:hypothetical protein